MRISVFVTGLILGFSSTFAGDINGLSSREGLSLNGDWKIIVDPYENGYYNYRWLPFDAETHASRSAYFMDSKAQSPTDLIEYDFDKSKSIQVPGDWNTQIAQLYYYEGTVWYRKKFDYSPSENKKQFIFFDAVNYKAEVYLNGHKLGTHTGGFTPFYFDVTNRIHKGSNSLVVKVDNKRLKEGVPTLNTDWWNYGGITRKVRVIETPENFISDFELKLESVESKTVNGHIQLSDTTVGVDLVVSIPELKKELKLKTNDSGRVKFSFNTKKLELWSPENPKLYSVHITTADDELSDRIGFRTIRTEGKKILLNNEPVFLKGICIHEEYPVDGQGRVNNAEKAKQLLTWAKELNCNFVRLAHYPHNEEMLRLADEMGIMVWEEVPVYWTIDWTNEDTYKNAENQLSEVMLRDRNRASVIIWSLANETPVNENRTKFLTRLAEHAKNIDNSRLLSAAMERHDKEGEPHVYVVEDPLAEVVDLVSFNQYTGWYGSTPDLCSKIKWEISYDKPVFISEFGAGCKQGLHGDKMHRWTEEYQEYLYEETIEMLGQIDGLCGFSPWILVDFRSPRRVLPEIQDDFNRKGLISDEGIKKKAFFVLQKFYSEKE
ncbi:MAG: beta galactosidase jelly roll domain-containing protein [Bacteroidales bacterium]|nr:beta galactosidase jelly roll domain-containing protein [Bacteroidales bacterium]MBN2819116.1 beta galactosidase jelly roll domain-containing protein [Bacteroidales bacterium]